PLGYEPSELPNCSTPRRLPYSSVYQSYSLIHFCQMGGLSFHGNKENEGVEERPFKGDAPLRLSALSTSQKGCNNRGYAD
ncbi:MAG: hypothetical protein ABF484_07135, partial [Bifidobacterium sp.]|uniref:hypothetical protein n=1 Tax=Bifidobacterium sp. TaxID=41200 RepID=UPI0039E982F9